MIWLVWSGRNSLSLPLRSTQTKGANLNMKILQVLTSSLFIAAAAFAQSPEKTKSAEIFETRSPEEKKLWHSHNYEVKSGVLTAPDMPDAAEKDLVKALIGTYGKTWHTWQVDRGDKLPLGIPQLMMAFTADGQAKA